jgi:hypothetical protein
VSDHELASRTVTGADLAVLAGAEREALSGVLDGVDEEALADLLAADGEPVLRAVFARMPEFYTGARFDPAVLVRWHVRRDPADPVRYDLRLDADGGCAVAPAPEPGPPADVTLTLDASDFLRMTFGASTGMDLLMRGRLALDGDGNLAVRLESLFGLGAGNPS